MKFRGFFEDLLGTRVKARLLEHMFREEAVTSERELARMLGFSHVAVNRTMKELHELNLLEPTRIGNVLAWYLNKDSYAYWALTNLKEAAHKSPLEELKDRIQSFFKGITEALRVVLIGSVAEGKEASDSDIDLFILVDGERERSKLLSKIQELNNTCLRRYGNKISPTVLTHKDVLAGKHKHFLKSIQPGITLKS